MMDLPLNSQHYEQDYLCSTPLKKLGVNMDDRNVFANSFSDSPAMEKMARNSSPSKDEFWDALSSNYDYLMDDGLIATCREASSDLSFDDENEIPESYCWSFSRFIEQFKYLHDLLHHLLVEKEGSGIKTNPAILEEQQNIAYLCKLFNEQAQKLSKRYPDMRDEVHRHLNLLNNKWEAVEQSINSSKGSPSKDGAFDEITNRMRFLRKGLRDLENRLCSISEVTHWTVDSLEEKMKKQQVLQKDIEAKGKYVISLLKLCEHLHGNVRFGQNSLPLWDGERVRRVVSNLQNRWHSIWLQSLECNCKLEELMKTFKTENIDKLEKSFSEEPVKKYPRLSDKFEDLLVNNGRKSKMSIKPDNINVDYNGPTDVQQQNGNMINGTEESTPKNDKAVMVGATGIAELKAECSGEIGKFEIIQDVGYSSETSVHYSTDEKLDTVDSKGFNNISINTVYVNSNACEQQFTNDVCVSVPEKSHIYLAPDKYPSYTQRTWKECLIEDQNIHRSKFNSCKSVPDDFYKVTSVDAEILDVTEATIYDDNADEVQHVVKDQPASVIEQRRAEKVLELVNKVMPHPCPKNFTSASRDKKSISLPNNSPSSTIQRKNKKGSKFSIQNVSPKPEKLHENSKRSARVVEWLNMCKSGEDLTSDDNFEPSGKGKIEWLQKNVVDSSCDASGECTSDSERSEVSDDVNNSVSFSQSFTGSIETVVPVLLEESLVVQRERAGSAEPSPGVKMRRKKRGNRDRPWSVIELRQTTFVPPSMPHSISESALERLSSSNARTSCPKKFSQDNTPSCVTDISALHYSNVSSHNADQSIHSSGTVHCGPSSVRPLSSKRTSSFSGKGSDKYEAILHVSAERSSESSAQNKNHVEKCVMDGDCTSAEELDKLETTPCQPEQSSIVSSTEKHASVLITNDGNVEDHGSISDQAWDEYQDPPYLSEPYSEQTADEDELKKLTHFGEDYRAHFGSYSDTSSICARISPLKGRRRSRSRSFWKKSRSHDDTTLHSDSDSEDFHDILATSHHALQYVSNSIKENTQKFSELSSEFDELVATCQVNLTNLHEIHEELLAGCEIESFSKEDINKLQNLIKEWETLQVKLLSPSKNNEQKATAAELEASEKNVRYSIDALKEKLSELESKASKVEGTVSSLESLDCTIQDLQAALTNLQELKQPVFSIRAQIHRLKSDGGGPATILLHDDANKLYQQWETVYEIICAELTIMQTLRSEWHQPTEKEVSCETETAIQWKPVQVGGTLPKIEVTKEAFLPSAAVEVQIAEMHDILMEIETDAALTTIKYGIVEEDLEESVLRTDPPVLQKTHIKKEAPKKAENLLRNVTPPRSRLWRLLKASFPIHIVLLVLYCMSCFMQPQCCENLNNYEYSLLPQLRYIRGPPPV